MFFLFFTVINTINTVLVAIFVFDTRVTEQKNKMIKRGKSCKEKKGMSGAKYSITKMDFKIEN